IVPNIHKASHKKIPGKSEDKTKNAKTRNANWYRFKYPSKPHYENWMANGHAEIKCSCGQGKLKSVREPNKSGGVTIATKGNCPTCGNITITSGCWQSTQHKTDGKRYYVRCLREDQADWTLGNSLTFNSKLSKAYGQDRFGWGESFHATVRRRFGLLKDKSWMRDITEVKTEFAIASCAISTLLLQRQADQQATASSPRSPQELLPLAA
ncbi:MAG TPA: hypothetical protein VFO36_11700, partial [Nitrospiraceae bacterium]|nr:hypothetical protein [Nitrospiraceae bacterium]